MKTKIEIGSVYGKLTILNEVEPYVSPKGEKKPRVSCKCECGNITETTITLLRKGLTKSCGCIQKEIAKGNMKKLSTKHNMRNSTEYNSWKAMKARCINPKASGYHNYGGRGITIYDGWLNSFELFYNDMGSKPTPEHSLDRINNNGNYEPSNCRWSTPKEQANNRQR